jgi:predicted nuclease with TOPRIM domain
VSITDLLKTKLEKQLNSLNEKLEAAEAEARAKKASAEADAAGAELEKELLGRVNELKDKLIEGQAYLEELADAGEEKSAEIKARLARFFD